MLVLSIGVGLLERTVHPRSRCCSKERQSSSNGLGLAGDFVQGRHETHDRAKIDRVVRPTISEATESIPEIENPESVTDVLFQVGLNDSRRGLSAHRIRDDTLEMQMSYKRKFKNARQHIVALPPLSDTQIATNQSLQKLANHTNSNFVTTRAFRDRMTGQLRKNLMNDFHYNTVGVKTLAREIKKSIFSVANLHNNSLNTLNEMEESVRALNRSLNGL